MQVEKATSKLMVETSEEIITMLSNLGAIEESKAISPDILRNSQKLKERPLDEDLRKLIETGYVKAHDDKLYLTKVGLFRALSRFS